MKAGPMLTLVPISRVRVSTKVGLLLHLFPDVIGRKGLNAFGCLFCVLFIPRFILRDKALHYAQLLGIPDV